MGIPLFSELILMKNAVMVLSVGIQCLLKCWVNFYKCSGMR